MAITLTPEATKKILKIMNETGLDPKRYAIEISIQKGRLGINFLREQDYLVHDELDGLKVVHMNDKVHIRFVEVNGKQGFVFE